MVKPPHGNDKSFEHRESCISREVRMNKERFDKKIKKLFADHKKLLSKKNIRIENGNGIYYRYKYPIITAEHTPLILAIRFQL